MGKKGPRGGGGKKGEKGGEYDMAPFQLSPPLSRKNQGGGEHKKRKKKKKERNHARGPTRSVFHLGRREGGKKLKKNEITKKGGEKGWKETPGPFLFLIW